MITIKRTKKFVYVDSDKYVDEKRTCTAQWLEWEWTVRLGRAEWDAWEAAGAPTDERRDITDHIAEVLGEGKHPQHTTRETAEEAILCDLLRSLEVGKRGIKATDRNWTPCWLPKYKGGLPSGGEDAYIPEDTTKKAPRLLAFQ